MILAQLQSKVFRWNLLRFLFLFILLSGNSVQAAFPVVDSTTFQSRLQPSPSRVQDNTKNFPASPNANVALIFGILSLISIIAFLPLSIAFGIVAIIFGSIGIKKGNRIKRARAGLILGAIGTILGLAVLALLIWLFAFLF